MPVDASIYGLIRPQQRLPGAMDMFGQALSIKNLVGQGKLQGLQVKQAEDAITRQGQLRDLFARGDVKPEEVMAIDPAQGLSYRKTLREEESATAQRDKAKAETLVKQMEILRDMTARVADDSGLARVRETAVRLLGPQAIEGMPQSVADQNFRAWQAAEVMDASKFIEQNAVPRTKQLEIDTTRRGQNMTAASAAAGRAVTARGQDLSAATTRRGQDLTERRERDPELAAKIEAARAGARESAKTQADAAAQLPDVLSKAEQGISVINQMLGSKGLTLKPGEKAVAAHPGFEDYVGATWRPGMRYMEGSHAAGFETLYNQITGQAFLQAFQSLKGGGHITEIEGTKGTQAITRMNKAQSEAEFVKAAREFEEVIRAGAARAKAKAGRQAAPPATPLPATPAGQTASGGIRFLGFEGE